jgi:hypothetical protein
MWTVPTNTWGSISYQYAYDGNAYVGGDLLKHIGGNGRTYVQVKLSDSLVNNHCYYVEFYTNLTNSSKYACNNVSVSLSKNQLWQSSNPTGVIPFNAQIYNYGNPIIHDTVNWVRVSAVYTAQGGEKYLTFGNFKNDNQTNYVIVDSFSNVYTSSYYFDAIQVISLDMEPAYANAFAGDDITIATGDSAFIGSLTNGITNIAWYNAAGQKIDSIRPGFYVKPTSSTFYVVAQTVCGNYSTDTVFVNVNPLPLTISSYQLVVSNEKQVLNKWVSLNEINVSHFNVQRSVNTKDFITIGKVSANNKSYNEYNFIDDVGNLELGIKNLYYRVVSVDNDGRKNYSSIQSLNIQHSTSNIILYPNPAKDVVTIECKGAKELQIVDYWGRIIYRLTVGSQPLTVNTKQLPKGLYVVKVVISNGEIKTEKLIVE